MSKKKKKSNEEAKNPQLSIFECLKREEKDIGVWKKGKRPTFNQKACK